MMSSTSRAWPDLIVRRISTHPGEQLNHPVQDWPPHNGISLRTGSTRLRAELLQIDQLNRSNGMQRNLAQLRAGLRELPVLTRNLYDEKGQSDTDRRYEGVLGLLGREHEDHEDEVRGEEHLGEDALREVHARCQSRIQVCNIARKHDSHHDARAHTRYQLRWDQERRSLREVDNRVRTRDHCLARHSLDRVRHTTGLDIPSPTL
ncbi:hypothetical protein F4820DRAFT_308465 [Hypoxylon rubiginosum]|uniref:Uncharacterized protein n=1 Tax=Hypoxylon rubiginosum TaxID=110542 RepID=A0ACB9Z071_9PEZI|nr:hypothetical protein F4820DRAFT_308465 [Hypoxylon rubiginosum]